MRKDDGEAVITLEVAEVGQVDGPFEVLEGRPSPAPEPDPAPTPDPTPAPDPAPSPVADGEYEFELGNGNTLPGGSRE